MARACLVCGSQCEERWKFCLECGARNDESANHSIRAIDYLLAEVESWQREELIDNHLADTLTHRYQDLRQDIISNLIRPRVEVKPEASQPVTPPTAISDEPTISNAPAVSPLQAVIDAPVPEAPAQSSPVQAIAAAAASQAPAAPVPARSLSELVAENIRYIFAVSVALFVGGIALYFRDEIYFRLTQPITQALLLALTTLALLVGGVMLVRRTGESLAGRTMALTGALMVPINPWFLVRSNLIANTGRGWILALACTFLYGSIAYYLRERLFVYIALATGIITGWATVFKFSGNASASIYAVVLMACAITYLLAERAFQPQAEEFSREEFGAPFFYVAHAGIALCLLFYTPVIKLLPAELVAVKRYFDPQGYNDLVTVWLALAAAFAYLYSGVTRRAGYFIYLAIGTLGWSITALLVYLDAALPTALLVFICVALVMQMLARLTELDELYAEPLSNTARALGLLACVGSLALYVPFIDDGVSLPGWRIVAALPVAAAIFLIELIKTKSRSAFYLAATLLANATFYGFMKAGVPGHLIAIFMLVPAYRLLLMRRAYREREPLARDLQIFALTLTSAIVLGALIALPVMLTHQLWTALLAAGIAGLCLLSAFQTDHSDGRAAQYYIAIGFSALAYLSVVSAMNPRGLIMARACALFPYGLIAAALYLRGRQQTVSGRWQETELPLRVSALLATGAAVIYWNPAHNHFQQHSAAGIAQMALYAGVLLILSHWAAVRAFSLIGAFIGGALLTASYTFALVYFQRGIDDDYILTAFAGWSLALYAVAQVPQVRAEIRASLSVLSSLIAGLFFITCSALLIFVHGFSDASLMLAVLSALVIIMVKEVWHLTVSRSVVHAIFTALAGISVTLAMLRAVDVHENEILAWLALLAIGYGLLSQRLTRQAIERKVYLAFEVTGCVLAAICLLSPFYGYYAMPGAIVVAVALTVIHFALSAYLTGATVVGRGYAHVAAGALIITIAVFYNYLGDYNAGAVAALMVAILSLFLLAETKMRATVFGGALFNVAQVAQPLFIAIGLWEGLNHPSTHLSAAIFFGEITAFYLIAALVKRQSAYLYPTLFFFALVMARSLQHVGMPGGYFMIFYGVLALALIMLARRNGAEWWAAPACLTGAYCLSIFAAGGAILQTIGSIDLYNSELNPLIVTLLGLTGMAALASTLAPEDRVKVLYRQGAYGLAFFAYLAVGVRLGYDLLRQTEFYALPFGAVLMVAGYLMRNKAEERTAALWLWLGSLCWSVPLLLHFLNYRFIAHEPSTAHDIGLMVVSVAMILGGIIFQIKAPTIAGGATFLLGLAVIVFSFVEWEQKWLSISMIVLALVVFFSSWIIYSFYRRNQLGRLSEQGRQVMEEFGKWK